MVPLYLPQSKGLPKGEIDGRFKASWLEKPTRTMNPACGDLGTPLHLASALCDMETVAMLLEAGADTHALGCVFGDALRSASAEGQEFILKLLLHGGASPTTRAAPFGSACLAAMLGETTFCTNIPNLLQSKSK
jgi:ankyrin repeat protein